jgi:hypothetical protein
MSRDSTSAAYYTGRETQKAITTQVIPIAFAGQQTVRVPINVSYPVGRIVFKPINLSNLTSIRAPDGITYALQGASAYQEPLMVYSSIIDNSCCGITGIFVQVANAANPPQANPGAVLSGYAITMPNDIVTQFKAPRIINGEYTFSLGSQLNGGAWAPGPANAAVSSVGGAGTPINTVLAGTGIGAPNVTSVFYGAITVQIEFLEY